jgi:hypothetical protein
MSQKIQNIIVIILFFNQFKMMNKIKKLNNQIGSRVIISTTEKNSNKYKNLPLLWSKYLPRRYEIITTKNSVMLLLKNEVK